MIISPIQTARDHPRLLASWKGRLDYDSGYELQRAAHAKRIDDESPDRLLLLEHPTVLTRPRRDKNENLLVKESFLRERGASVHPTDRGGEVTLHNPGQLVGYLVCRLEPGKRDLRGFLRWIEERLEKVAAAYGVRGGCRKGMTGLWVGDRKLASIGIAVKKWTTLHGFAINVNNDLTPFSWIHPCGLTGVRMTSLAQETGHALEWKGMLEETVQAFGAEWEEGSNPFPLPARPVRAVHR